MLERGVGEVGAGRAMKEDAPGEDRARQHADPYAAGPSSAAARRARRRRSRPPPRADQTEQIDAGESAVGSDWAERRGSRSRRLMARDGVRLSPRAARSAPCAARLTNSPAPQRQDARLFFAGEGLVDDRRVCAGSSASLATKPARRAATASARSASAGRVGEGSCRSRSTPAAAAAKSVSVPRRPQRAGERAVVVAARLGADVGRERLRVPGEADQPRARAAKARGGEQALGGVDRRR